MHEKVVPRKTYILIWAILIALTFGTWGIATIDLGSWNMGMALLIAFIKATLVALFFMHMKFSPKRTQLVLIAGLFWLSILLMLTMADYATRMQLPSTVNPPLPTLTDTTR